MDKYQESLSNSAKDPVVGPFLADGGRKRSDGKVSYMEEGKKRLE